MTHETTEPTPKAILVAVPTPDVSNSELETLLTELGGLAETLGFEVVDRIHQRRRSIAGGTVLGEGKLRELAQRTGGSGVITRTFAKTNKAALKRAPAPDPSPAQEPAEQIQAVIFDCELSPSQMSNLQRALGVEILDRTGVIVEIFSRHAHTREARLQVEMARLKYTAPRTRAVGSDSSRMNRAGESAIELENAKFAIVFPSYKMSLPRSRRSKRPVARFDLKRTAWHLWATPTRVNRL